MTNFICISGEAQHGKDTSAEFIRAELETLGEDAIVIHYADLLKFICKTYFGWNGEKDEAGREKTNSMGSYRSQATGDPFRSSGKPYPQQWIKKKTGPLTRSCFSFVLLQRISR